MPLVIFCGIPCSGKSTRAKELYVFFMPSKKCVLIKDDNVPNGFDRNKVFLDAQKEKELRSSLKSEVERHLSKDTTVILDAGNYIKGYRYELYCLSKGCKTTHCVIHCDLLPKDCWVFNEKHDSSEQYSQEVFDALVQRFETPDSRNRWDSPLFISHKDENLPLKGIEEALYQRKAPPPNLSTQCQPLAATNFLYDLDKVTQGIVKSILNAQKLSTPGDFISLPDADQKIHIMDPLTAGELARIRRQFISYMKSHPVSDGSKIPNMFVQFVNKNIH
ncbi:protein KTI12 homolog [Trichonephila clavata]|uniref:Protein KTI12 homolog n=1 Tax=Trichonephila clavata TaxID=2740835 RepID=A0A8X6H7U0_TRICU|nr:protein KTI12 homolog [Trichonephila clavata]